MNGTTDDLFPKGTYKDIRLDDKLAELTREIRVRRRVYPRWAAKGKIDPVIADKRILVLEAIRKDYRDDRLRLLEKLLEEWVVMDDEHYRLETLADLNERSRRILGMPDR